MKHFSVFDFFSWAEKRKNDFYVHNYETCFFFLSWTHFQILFGIGNLNFFDF